MTTTLNTISTDAANKIAAAFKQKAAQSGIMQGSKTYRNMHFDYFYGAIQALDALGYACPSIWALNLMSSRDISDDGKPI